MYLRALSATILSLSLMACATPMSPQAPQVDADHVFAPVQAAMACPAPPYALTTPAPVPGPPKAAAGSYRAIPAYVVDLLGWIAADRDRSRRREDWQRQVCKSSDGPPKTLFTDVAYGPTPCAEHSCETALSH
jgi:hypothetical protein